MLVLRFSRTARRRTLAYTVALLASLAICYHPALALLYRNTGYCYDVFCFFFYYSALAYYLRIRNRGRLPTWKQTASLLTLLVLALDSKEMAVTLPVILAIYELLFWPPARARELPRWLSREGRTAVLGSLVVAAFVIGRVYATPYGLAHQGAYHPDFTVQTWAANWWFWLAAMLDEPSTGEILVVLLTLVVAVLAGPWRKVLVFGLLLAIVGALPVSFIPTRDLSSIYVALLGLAVVAGTLASAAASIVLRGERLAAVRPWLVPAICMTILFARYNSVSRLERSWQDPESMQI
ncbi:MAG: hypothetical protein HYS04_08225, partial [Acidobacteria bacterium]|nr:hypothetical protein [Acidobacteriota bacterium]